MEKISLLNALVLGLSLYLFGCGNFTERPNFKGHSSWVQQPAPQSDKQTGFIVSNTSIEDVEKIEKKFPDLKIRVISVSLGIFELIGLDEATLKEALPKAELQKNELFQNLTVRAASVDQAPSMAMISSGPHCKSFENPAKNSLRLKIKANVDVDISTNRQIFPLQKKPLILTVEQNEGVPLNDEMRLFWSINGPDYFAANRKINESKKLTLLPDLTGVYSITVIVQDSHENCYQNNVRFAVTAQEGLGPNRPRRRLENMDLKQESFAYLDELGIRKFWPNSRGSGVRMAIIDSGVSYNHPDLRANILTRQQHLVGWDFVHGNDRPSDDFGHGTIVAGLAAGTIAGVAPEAKIMPIKVLNAFGDGDAASIQAGLFFAIENGAEIIVAAFGDSNPALEKALQPALNEAEKRGILVVAAAGNHGADLDQKPQYPACSGNSNILTVAALTDSGQLAPYSNFGLSCVDIATVGGEPRMDGGDPLEKGGLLGPSSSHSEKGLYARKFGTSMAVPIVAGAAALLKGLDSTKDATILKKELLALGKYNQFINAKVKNSLELSLGNSNTGHF